jgi:hypothetical protein
MPLPAVFLGDAINFAAWLRCTRQITVLANAGDRIVLVGTWYGYVVALVLAPAVVVWGLFRFQCLSPKFTMQNFYSPSH